MAERSTSFEAIGTRWHISVQDRLEPAAWTALVRAMHRRIGTFDKTYSRFRPDSLVSRMAQSAGSYALPEDGFELLRTYEQLYHLTGGRVTPLIGQVMADAGYDARYSFVAKPLTPPPAWDETITYEHDSITLAHPALLDFGAAGKGYLVDIIAGLIHEAGVESFVINAGGDVLQHSRDGQALAIGLENPLDATEVIGVAQLLNGSLCGSAGGKRKWGGYTHIIDPGTLGSPQDILATWVRADDAMHADGLATALYFADPKTLRQQFVFSYAVLTKDMQLAHSPEFPVQLFEATT